MQIATQPESPSEEQLQVKNDFLFEWFCKFHNSHRVLRIIYKFSKQDCLFNLRYLAMAMHLGLSSEFEAVIEAPNGSLDDLEEHEIKDLWSASYQAIEMHELTLRFQSSLKAFFKEKGLQCSSLLKQVFQRLLAQD